MYTAGTQAKLPASILRNMWPLVKTTFQDVLDLQPPPSLFPWTSVSNIPAKLLPKAIDKLKENASKLKPPLSSDKISDLKWACITFRDACSQYHCVKNA